METTHEEPPAMPNGAELNGKVAVVTGAARNIGRAIALSLAAGGASVLVNARTSAEQAQETVDLINAAGGTAALYLADITQPAEAEGLMTEAISKFGRIDVLVNNAAVRREIPFLEMTLEEWRSVTAVILDGAFLCTRFAMPHLIAAGGGSVINLGGQSGHLAVAERAHVIASKAGLVGFTRAIAVEFAADNVTVNCVVPGSVDTVRGLPGAPPRPPSHKDPPLGRLGSTQEVAAMIRLLAGPEGHYITGQTIHVNGGAFMP